MLTADMQTIIFGAELLNRQKVSNKKTGISQMPVLWLCWSGCAKVVVLEGKSRLRRSVRDHRLIGKVASQPF